MAARLAQQNQWLQHKPQALQGSVGEELAGQGCLQLSVDGLSAWRRTRHTLPHVLPPYQ